MYELRFLEKDDFHTLLQWSGDESFLLQWGGPGFHYPLDTKQLEQFLDGANIWGQSDRFIYKVIDQENGNMVGHISLGALNMKHRTGRIGKVLTSPKLCGNGIGEWMMKEVCRIGFEKLALHRIGLGVFDFNHSAIRCYEKVGFKKDGLLRDVVQVNGGYWDMYEMSMLQHEWRTKIGDK